MLFQLHVYVVNSLLFHSLKDIHFICIYILMFAYLLFLCLRQMRMSREAQNKRVVNAFTLSMKQLFFFSLLFAHFIIVSSEQSWFFLLSLYRQNCSEKCGIQCADVHWTPKDSLFAKTTYSYMQTWREHSPVLCARVCFMLVFNYLWSGMRTAKGRQCHALIDRLASYYIGPPNLFLRHQALFLNTHSNSNTHIFGLKWIKTNEIKTKKCCLLHSSIITPFFFCFVINSESIAIGTLYYTGPLTLIYAGLSSSSIPKQSP